MCVGESGSGVGLAVINCGHQALEQIASETAPEGFLGENKDQTGSETSDANRGHSELQPPRMPTPQ